MGRGARFGDKHNASVVFATNGLVQQWYASDGEDFLWDYDGIFFDEIHAMETDPGYALLWEVALATQRKRDFLIVGASATFTSELVGRLNLAAVEWISCLERPFPVEKFEVQVPTNNEVYEAVEHFCMLVLRKSNTALVFLPGKSEIENMTSMLEKAGADPSCIFPFHSELDDEFLDKVKQPSARPRVILSTSLAETSITIPDVDFVIDVGLSRRIGDYHDILAVADAISSDAVKDQRLGRAGRVKPGCCIQITDPERRDLGIEGAWCDDSVIRVHALEPYHLKIKAAELSLCPMPEDVLADADNKLSDLHLSERNMWHCLTRVPLPFKDAATLLTAHDQGVGYEAAAVLAFKAECKWRDTQFNIRDLVAMVSGRDAQGFVPTALPGIKRLRKAQDVFEHLKDNLGLCPSHWDDNYLEEALALAFLSAPERLLWCDEVKGHGAAFLGEACAVTGMTEKTGCVVALLLHKGYHGISCSLALPATRWVLDESGLIVPTLTARIIGDSTILSFRAECCNRMRKNGYDVKVWYCKAGASEHQVAVSVATTGKSHLCVAVPNGNRLERQSGSNKPKWIKVVCEHLSAALADTAERAAVFVGDAALTPGATHPESYAALVPMLQDGLKAFGIEVIGQIAGVVLAADRKHWSISSRASVEELMDFLCSSSKPTSALMKQAKAPPLWHWKRNLTFDAYYPCCVACDKTAHDGHFTSKSHLQKTHGTRLSFDFPLREFYCSNYAVMHVGGNAENGREKSLYLPHDHIITPKNSALEPSGSTVTDFCLESLCGEELTPTVDISKKCIAHIAWSDRPSERMEFVWPKGASGRARSVLSAAELPWVVKCEKIVPGQPNRNRAEYEASGVVSE